MLNQAKHLFLSHISEPRDNALRLIVEEAVATEPEQSEMQATADQLPEIAALRVGARPIKSTDICTRFELLWRCYVTYLVTEELVGSGGQENDEVYKGQLFRQYDKSHFLDHLLCDTRGHTAPILHYKLICQNHLIDVASYDPPEIRVLGTVGEIEKPN